MCGICGVRRFGDEPIQGDQIAIMLGANEHRGNHATGLALQQADGSVQVLKQDIPAWRFIQGKAFKEFLEENLREDTLTFIGHTRFATTGRPNINKNNHPMWNGTTALVHNGMISNHDQLFNNMKLERAAETDSDILRAILDKHGFTVKGANELNKCNGSAAIAAVSTAYPGLLLLGRSGSPLETGATASQLLWSSERDGVYKAARPYEKRFGKWFRRARPDIAFMPMIDHTIELWSDKPKNQDAEELWDGDYILWHQEFKASHYYNTPNYCVNSNYWERNRTVNYGDKQVELIMCPNRKCKAIIPVTPEMALTNCVGWHCNKCQTDLK